jgi:hypothetical protein
MMGLPCEPPKLQTASNAGMGRRLAAIYAPRAIARRLEECFCFDKSTGRVRA